MLNTGAKSLKKCIHCGCINRDERLLCADCGQTLADAEIIGEEELDKVFEKASKYCDPFSFKPRYKFVFFASLALIVADIALIFLSLIRSELALLSILFGIVSVVITRFSETVWNIQKFFLSFSVNGDMEPSDGWFIGREITVFSLFGVNIIVFLYGLL